MFSRLLLLAACCFLGALPGFAQTYEPGLLVRSNGDTVRGEIENNFWVDPPKSIRFRRAAHEPTERLRPSQLQAVLFTSGRYFRYEKLPIDHASETRLDRLPQGYHPNVQVDSLLAEVLLEGPASLLRVARYSATHYVVRRSGQAVLSLSERKYLSASRAGNGKMTITDGNNYRAQLEQYFGDCPAAGRAAATAAFTPEGLVAVVQAYNAACTAGQPAARTWLIPATQVRRAAWRGGVLAGGRYLRRASLPSHAQASPFAGFYGEIMLPNRVVGVYGDLGVSLFTGEGTTLAYYNVTSRLVNGNLVDYYDPVYSTFSYRALLVSGRLGLRWYFRAAREQRWYAGISLEGNALVAPAYRITSGPAATPGAADLKGTTAPWLPELAIGWRGQRLAVGLDGLVFDNNVAARLSVAYRLSRHPDGQKPGAARQ